MLIMLSFCLIMGIHWQLVNIGSTDRYNKERKICIYKLRLDYLLLLQIDQISNKLTNTWPKTPKLQRHQLEKCYCHLQPINKCTINVNHQIRQHKSRTNLQMETQSWLGRHLRKYGTTVKNMWYNFSQQYYVLTKLILLWQ